MIRIIAVASLVVALGLPALAVPPEDALPLSEILAGIEVEDGFHYFEEIEWDDDGQWVIEYDRRDGSSVEMDARTGEPRG